MALPKLKKLKLNGYSARRNCAECSSVYSEFRWSPFRCPKCDEKRVTRIGKQLEGLTRVIAKKAVGKIGGKDESFL